eukprot:comp11003_c0_seq1/m.5557 comp11003_c0_seq1/g.5557  ORF comp11003_c0_seq1/g.5557 comp11003_c0_seq1/m.5557 type:complete len:182 (-) comp11003_c0_seq1:486-1031(-)
MNGLLKVLMVVGAMACQAPTIEGAPARKTALARAAPYLFDPVEILTPSKSAIQMGADAVKLRPGAFANKVDSSVPIGVNITRGVQLAKTQAPKITMNVAPNVTSVFAQASVSVIMGDLVWTGNVPGQLADRANLIANQEGGLYANIVVTASGHVRYFEVLPSETDLGYSILYEYQPPNLPD